MADTSSAKRKANAQPSPTGNDEQSVDPSIHAFELEIVQNPIRARMCGFGDRDRRPLTPPLIAKLTVRNIQTGAKVDPDTINISFFVLSADLWSGDRAHETNLVLHRSAPSSAGMPPYPPQGVDQYSYPPFGQPNAFPGFDNAGLNTPPFPAPRTQPPATDASPSYAFPPPAPSQSLGQSTTPLPPQPPNQFAAAPQPPIGFPRMDDSPAAVRNLVGALQSSAHRMKDLDGEMGIFFAFVDLSVRTEGNFSLHLVLTDLGSRQLTIQPSAIILAEVWTDAFEVLTAKRFPGMLEPTALSQAFARQGLRIPTRQTRRPAGDGKGKRGAPGGSDEDAEGDEDYD